MASRIIGMFLAGKSTLFFPTDFGMDVERDVRKNLIVDRLAR